MNKFKSTLITAAIIVGALPLMAQQTKVASSGGNSPHETISAVIDRNRVTITYGRPFTIKPGTTEVRKIWGGLVPYDKPWRMGADEATTLITQKPIVLGGTTVPAGAYTLYMVPSESGTSKLAISTNLGGWGIPVDTTHDLAQVDLKKDTLKISVDQFTIVPAKGNSGGGVLEFMWENTQYSVAFTIAK